MPNTLKIKRGTNATIPQGQLAEPLFTTDTYDLYIGKGSGGNQRFQKYIASGTSSQFLKGDGSLDSNTYQTALTFSSPLVNTSGTISIPAATGSVNGYLTSTDWTTFNSKEPAITAGTSLQYYRGDKTFQTLNTAAVPESGAIYFTEPRVLATVLTGLNLSGGGTIAATDSVLTAFGKIQNQISGIAGGVSYQGTWNANTNSPTLTSSVGTKGYYYVVSVNGSTNLNGITDWKVGDWAIFNGTTWDKVDNTDAVSSVNGFTGAVNLGLGNISDVTLSSPTNAQLLRFNGTSSKWENWTPTYISAAITSLNGLTAATQTFATGTTGTDFTISSSTSTHTFNIPSASATSRGLLTSGDYNTFAGKQSQITLTTTGTSGAATFVGATLNIPNYGSALSGYLPLTGGTLTGSLFGTTASFTSNTGNFTLGSQVDTAIYMHFGTKNASGGYGIGHRIAGTINATANFDNLHGLWVDYTDNVGAYVGVVKYAIFQPDSAKQNYFGGTTIFNSFIWAQSTIGIGVNSSAYDLYIRKTAAYAMIESYTSSATSQLYFKAVNASLSAVTGGIIYTPSTSGNHNIRLTPDTSTSLGMILNTNSAGFGVIPKATTYYSLQSDYGVLSGNLAANISSNSYYNSGWKFYGTGFATLYNQDPSTGKHEFFTSASGSSGGSVSFGTAKFSIAQSGAATFSGTGSFKSLGAAADVFTLGYSGAAVNMLQVYELSGGTNTEFNLRNSSGTSINRLSTNGNSFFNGGNVGIGTTSPAKVLDVYSSATNNTAQIVVSDASSTNRLYLGTFSNGSYISCGGTYSSGWSANGTNAIANIGMSASNGASTIQFETSTTNGAGPTERMRITSAGDMYLTGRSTNGDYGMYFYSNDTDSRIYSSNSGAVSKSLIFYTSGNPRMTITSGGNVQITVPSSTTQGILFKDVGGTSRGKVYYGDVSGEMYFGTMTGYSTVFVTNDTERMRITSGGNVGVGLTSPVVKLDVDGSVYSRGNLGASNGTQSTNTTSAVLYLGNRGYFTSADTGAAQIQAITSSPNWYSGTSLAFFTNPGPDVTATSAVERMRITSNGNINFNDTVYNNTAVATTRTLYIGSDYRIGGISSIRASKKNIENVSNINWLYQLNPVTFNYRKKDNDGKYTDEIYDELNYGLIAEDTAPIADFLINYNDKEDGTKEMIGIEYHRLITPLLKAIQELNQKITLLENK